MMIKRLFDFTMALVLLVTLSPVLVLISLLIWVSDGPAFFRQERVGCGGRSFKIIKFRSMVVDAEKQRQGGVITASSDRRITKIGRVLRRYKLDELPQLFNVLLGDMSFVGPRPEVPKYVALYPCVVREKVLSVPPGITDIASIEFYNEEEQLARVGDVEEVYLKKLLPLKLELAVEYVERRSLLLDIKLLAKTLFKVLRGKR